MNHTYDFSRMSTYKKLRVFLNLSSLSAIGPTDELLSAGLVARVVGD